MFVTEQTNESRTAQLPPKRGVEDPGTAAPELWVVCPATSGRYSGAENLARGLGVDPGHVILSTGGDDDGYEFDGVHLVFSGNPRESVLTNQALDIIHRHMIERGVHLWDVLVIDPDVRIARPQTDILRDTMRSLDTWVADPAVGPLPGDRAHLRTESVDDPAQDGPRLVVVSGETGIRLDPHILDADDAWQDFRRRARVCGGSALVELAG